MGMFGSNTDLNQMPTMDVPTAPAQHHSFFGEGGAGRGIAGYIGDALLGLSGHNPIYAPAMQAREKQQAALQQAMMLARFKAQNPEPTDLQNEAQSFGYKPGTPGYQQYISGVRMKPTFITLGNPETGQTVINPMAGGTGAPAVPQSQVIDGKTYYNVNGDWYDNPEGR